MATQFSCNDKKVLADITVTALTAGATHTTGVTGSSSTNGTSAITTIGTQPLLNSMTFNGLFYDVTDLVFVSPVVSNTSFPDCYVWPMVDGQDLGNVQLWDASAVGNMFPSAPKTQNGRTLRLGYPVRKMLEDGDVKNLPLRATGLKAAQTLQFNIYSAAGWTTSAITPLRIIALGDILDVAALNALSTISYPGQFQTKTAPFQGIAGVHTLAGGTNTITPSNWVGLSGGTKQAGTVIHRFFRTSYNAANTPASGPFILSQDITVQGASGNTANTNPPLGYDLGFNYSNANQYLRIDEAGIIPGTNNATWGVKIGLAQQLPAPYGMPATSGANLYPYGVQTPLTPSTGSYYTLPACPFPLAVNGQAADNNQAAFYIEANGTAIPSTSPSRVSIGGIHLTLNG